LKLFKTKLFPIIIICCLGGLIYSNSFSTSFHFDDFFNIVSNITLRNIVNLDTIWRSFPTRFITYLTFALNYQIHQHNVVGYHIVNLVVHISTAILLFWLVNLTLLTPVMRGEKIAKQAKLISLFIALVFLTHPIQTQGVTYIFQRSASLATLFYLASLGCYAKFRLLQNEKLASGSRVFYSASLIIAVIAMFTKEISITLPLAVCLYEFSFFRTTKIFKYKQLIFFLVTLAIIPITILMSKLALVRDLQATEGSVKIITWHYILTKLMVMITYIRLAFLPLNQNLDYDFPIVTHLLNVPVLFGLLFLILSIVIAFKLFRNYRLISFGILFFFLTLSFEWGIITISEVFYEHRLYLPMVGFSIFLVTSLYYLLSNKHPKAMLTILVTLVVVYSVLTYTRNNVWKDDFTLWNDTIRKSPYKARPYSNRGNAYQRKGNFDQAIVDYSKAIEVNPSYAEGYYNRGLAYQNKGDINQAISDYNKAIEINPNYSDAYNNRGSAYQHQGNFAQAFSDYNKALEINPKHDDAYYNRGMAYHGQGNLDQAILDFNRALKINPIDAEAYYNRGLAYQTQGNFNQAIADYDKAIEIDPHYVHAYYNRGLAYHNKGDLSQALLDYSKAIKINPNYFDAYNNRGTIYQNQGNFAQAISDSNKAIEINPNDSGFYNNRGIAYQHQGNFAQAFSDYNKAIEINPGYADAYFSRGNAYQYQGKLDQALLDFSKVLEINPQDAETYYNRAVVYNAKREYNQAWLDVHKAEELRYPVNPGFLEVLKKASGREK
jgi:protein O-mannosyl-transferase